MPEKDFQLLVLRSLLNIFQKLNSNPYLNKTDEIEGDLVKGIDQLCEPGGV